MGNNVHVWRDELKIINVDLHLFINTMYLKKSISEKINIIVYILGRLLAK